MVKEGGLEVTEFGGRKERNTTIGRNNTGNRKFSRIHKAPQYINDDENCSFKSEKVYKIYSYANTLKEVWKNIQPNL